MIKLYNFDILCYNYVATLYNIPKGCQYLSYICYRNGQLFDEILKLSLKLQTCLSISTFILGNRYIHDCPVELRKFTLAIKFGSKWSISDSNMAHIMLHGPYYMTHDQKRLRPVNINFVFVIS